MKRHLEMARQGVPKEGTDAKKFKGWRGVGQPKREWRAGCGPAVEERPHRRAERARLKAQQEVDPHAV